MLGVPFSASRQLCGRVPSPRTSNYSYNFRKKNLLNSVTVVPGSIHEPQKSQGAISNIIALGSLYYRLIQPNPDTVGWEGRIASNPQQDTVL